MLKDVLTELGHLIPRWSQDVSQLANAAKANSKLLLLGNADLEITIREIIRRDAKEGFECVRPFHDRNASRLEIRTQKGEVRRLYHVMRRLDDGMYVLWANVEILDTLAKHSAEKQLTNWRWIPISSQTLLSFYIVWLLAWFLAGLGVGFLPPQEPMLERYHFSVQIGARHLVYHMPQGYLAASGGVLIAMVIAIPLFAHQGDEHKRAVARYCCPNCRQVTDCRVDFEVCSDSPNCSKCGFDLIANCCWFCTRRTADPKLSMTFLMNEDSYTRGRRNYSSSTRAVNAIRCGTCFKRHRFVLLATVFVPFALGCTAFIAHSWITGLLPEMPKPFNWSLALAVLLLSILPVRAIAISTCRLLGTFPTIPRRYSWPGRRVRYVKTFGTSAIVTRTAPNIQMKPQRMS